MGERRGSGEKRVVMKKETFKQRFLFSALVGVALFFAACSDTGSGPSGATEADFVATFAPWPGRAIAAYTLIADDYCAGLSGQTHADTMMANRGMGMAFGAIVGNCGESDWGDAKAKIARGHEIINHSWSHPCFTNVTECGSGPVIGEEAYDLQLRQSSETIEVGTGFYPTFFIFPFDCATEASLDYLKNLRYLGARMGSKMELNGDTFDPFRPNFDVNWPLHQKQYQRWNLNEMVDAVLAQGNGWAIREIHGVDDGWGPISYDEMRDHANYLKTKVDAGQLWVAPPSEVVQYHNQREHYTLQTVVRLDTLTLEPIYLVEFQGTELSEELYNRPLTLVVGDLPELTDGVWEAKQSLSEPQSFSPGEEIRIEVFPLKGTLEIRKRL